MVYDSRAHGDERPDATGDVGTLCNRLQQLELDLLALWTTSIRTGDEALCDQLAGAGHALHSAQQALTSELIGHHGRWDGTTLSCGTEPDRCPYVRSGRIDSSRG